MINYHPQQRDMGIRGSGDPDWCVQWGSKLPSSNTTDLQNWFLKGLHWPWGSRTYFFTFFFSIWRMFSQAMVLWTKPVGCAYTFHKDYQKPVRGSWGLHFVEPLVKRNTQFCAAVASDFVDVLAFIWGYRTQFCKWKYHMRSHFTVVVKSEPSGGRGYSNTLLVYIYNYIYI